MTDTIIALEGGVFKKYMRFLDLMYRWKRDQDPSYIQYQRWVPANGHWPKFESVDAMRSSPPPSPTETGGIHLELRPDISADAIVR